MSKHREQSRWLWAAAVVALTAALTFLLSDLVFQTNDDNSIISAACGGVTGAPYAGNYPVYLVGNCLGRQVTFGRYAARHAAGDIA